MKVAVFTDTYHATINGAASTVSSWANHWNRSHGTMQVVYPRHPDYTPAAHEYPVPSVPFPMYESYRMGVPWVPGPVRDADVVHLHSLYSVGIGGGIFATLSDRPLVATYHTPINEYTDYVIESGTGSGLLARALRVYERFMLNRVDRVIAPSAHTERYLREVIGTTTSISVISNGIDTALFHPGDGEAFRDRYDLSGPVIGYTGRHGYEKHLEDILQVAERLDDSVTIVFGGDGPAREELETAASQTDAEIRFLGFLPREQLPGFYAALDAFAFPSPVETEGIVAMESIACGTPVVGVEAGALQETIAHGQTGYLYDPGGLDQFARYLARAIENSQALRAQCLEARPALSVTHSIERIEELYRDLLSAQA